MKLKEPVTNKRFGLEYDVRQLRSTNHNLELEIKKNNTAKQQMRKALIAERELGQLKTRLLSLASHEFRTPLSGILTSASLIDKYIPKKNEDVTRHLDVIKSMVSQLVHVLDDFLSLDQLDSGKIRYRYSEFELNELMETILKESSPLLKKEQFINYIPCEQSPNLYQDKKIVHLILTNILFNAIKYSQEASTITIIVQSEKDICIEIKDQGIGIPIQDQKNIFRKFFRASNVKHVQGTGIGLNIVETNVKALGGSVSVKSKEGQGTSFIVRIPRNSTP